MKYSRGFCPSRAGRLSKAGVAGVKGGLCRAAVAVAVIGCVGTSAAFADTNVLPDPSFGILYPEASTGTSVPTPLPLGAYAENLALLDPGAVSGALSAEGKGEPFPSVAMSVQFSSTANCGCGGEFQATSALNYYVEFTGPTADVSVDVSGSYKLTANGPAGSEVSLAVAAQYIFPNFEDTAGVATSPFSTVVSLPTGTPIVVEMWAETYFTELPGTMSASAYVDPYFSIDPSNADASAYSILVSPSVGNAPSTGVPGTPEPATWAMMLLGFAGLGWAGWRGGRIVGRTTRTPV